jgi:homoserine kinase type II
LPTELSTQHLLSAASGRWGLDLSHLRPDLTLAGSPERTVWRSVVEALDGHLFVLEKIPSNVYDRKRRIAATLQQLVDNGLQEIVSYLPDVDGEAISLINQGTWHGLWQLCPYVAGEDLNRPTYAFDGWRGDAAAAFLIQIDKICSIHTSDRSGESFSIAAYCRRLFTTLAERQPEIAAQYRSFMDHLEENFFPLHDRLPTGFCHGDFHPLNIIWGEQAIRAVIDWEFCGLKPEIYDLANLLGCLGIEDPRSLAGPFAMRLIFHLKKAGIFDQASWKAMPDLMLAIRFAWLSEWLRKNDRLMIRLEADYMALLLKQRTALIHPAIND